MDKYITIKETELRSILNVFAQEILKEMGFKQNPVQSEWISFNKATKIAPTVFGRARLERAILTRIVREKPNNHEKAKPIRLVNKSDVENCIKQRLI